MNQAVHISRPVNTENSSRKISKKASDESRASAVATFTIAAAIASSAPVVPAPSGFLSGHPGALTGPGAAKASCALPVFAAIPPIGDINAYVSAATKMPMLEIEQEHALACRVRDSGEHGDALASDMLVKSHLRLVISLARPFMGYGLPLSDLIQEGNIGLMKAVERFDPDYKVRLVSYAMHWIRAEIREYVLRNSRIIRIATTKDKRKLFFNLRSIRARLQAETALANPASPIPKTLNAQQISTIALELEVCESEVREMEIRLNGTDLSIDGDEGEPDESFSFIHRSADSTYEPTAVMERKERDKQSTTGLASALCILDDRSRRIVESRWIEVKENGLGLTLHDLAAEYGVSAERIRQIEVSAMKKMRKHLS